MYYNDPSTQNKITAAFIIILLLQIGMIITIVYDEKEKVEPTPSPTMISTPKASPSASPTPTITRKDIDAHIFLTAKEYNIDPYVVMAIIYQESRFKAEATNHNCVGLMQINKVVHRDRAIRLGIDNFYNEYDNILLGIDYLHELSKTNKDPKLVLMLYNMRHETAYKLYKKGTISKYAKAVMLKADEYRNGG